MEKQNYFGVKVDDIEEYKQHREGSVLYKDCALTVQFAELDGLLNVTKFSRRFFGKTHAWFSQRLNRCVVNCEKSTFKAEDYEKISAGYRELAKQLNQYADELDKAKMYD